MFLYAEVDHTSSEKEDVKSKVPETNEAGASNSTKAKEETSKSSDVKAQSTVSQPPSISRRDSDFAKKKKAAAAREEAGRPRLTDHPKSPTKPKVSRQGSTSSKSSHAK